jgi:hypothetical protein
MAPALVLTLGRPKTKRRKSATRFGGSAIASAIGLAWRRLFNAGSSIQTRNRRDRWRATIKVLYLGEKHDTGCNL